MKKKFRISQISPISLIRRIRQIRYPRPSKRNRVILLAFSILILLNLSFLLLFRLFSAKKAVAAWFDETWGYRQRVDITNAGTAQTDFQVAITLDTAALITAGKMQTDCDDIRVTDIGGKVLPIWIETGAKACNTTTTAIWTKVPSISTTGTTVYLYYGNSSAINVQNGNNVFTFFDDFSSTSIDSNKWTQGTIGATSGTSFSQSAGTLIGGNTNRYIQSLATYTGDYAAETRIYETSSAANGFTSVGFYASSSNCFGILIHAGTTYVREDADWPNIGSFAAGQWARDKVKVVGTSAIAWRTSESSGEVTNSFTNSGISGEYLRLGPRYDDWASDQNFSATWDWLFIRKTATTEPTVASPTAEEKSPGPVAYWKFDEGYGTAANNSGSGGSTYNATLASSTSTPIWSNSGKFSKALTFDGSDDYATINNNLPTLTEGTLSLWAKRTGTSGTYQFLFTDGGSQLEMCWLGVSTLSFYVNNVAVNTATASDLNTWYHLVGTFSETGNFQRIYINGVLANSTTYQGDATTAVRYFGSRAGSYPFKGDIDEVKVYNSALTEDEIKLDYNQSAALVLGTMGSNTSYEKQAANQEYCVPGDSSSCAAPVGEWKFEEKTGTTAYDTSGNNRNLTLGNTPTWTIGKKGAALDFDRGDYAYQDWTDFTISNHTIEFWVKARSLTGGWEDLVGTYLGTDLNRFHFYSGTSAISFYNIHGSCGSLSSGVVPVIGQWYHVAGVTDGTNAIIYINGQRKNSGACTGSHTSTGVYLAGPSGETFDGQIDDVRIYNYALSTEQVKNLYNAGAAVQFAPITGTP